MSKKLLLALLCCGCALLASCEKEKETTTGEETNRDTPTTGQAEPPKTKVEFEWALIPEGTFMMGSPESDEDAYDVEKPQHSVRMSSFWMSKTEVTFDQYDAFCKATSRQLANDGEFGRGKHPVINVTWDDAQAFCKWAGVELPTEAQWEYACRAKGTTRYSFGDVIETTQANIGESSWEEDGEEVSEQPRIVGQYEPNAFGLYDMHGNVAEMCLDAIDESFYQTCLSKGTVENPISKGAAGEYVARGGCYMLPAEEARSAHRLRSQKADALDIIGFRVVVPIKK